MFSRSSNLAVAAAVLTAVAGYTTNGSAVIADIFPPAQRGTASGVFMISMLIGPVIGKVLYIDMLVLL